MPPSLRASAALTSPTCSALARSPSPPPHCARPAAATQRSRLAPQFASHGTWHTRLAVARCAGAKRLAAPDLIHPSLQCVRALSLPRCHATAAPRPAGTPLPLPIAHTTTPRAARSPNTATTRVRRLLPCAGIAAATVGPLSAVLKCFPPRAPKSAQPYHPPHTYERASRPDRFPATPARAAATAPAPPCLEVCAWGPRTAVAAVVRHMTRHAPPPAATCVSVVDSTTGAACAHARCCRPPLWRQASLRAAHVPRCGACGLCAPLPARACPAAWASARPCTPLLFCPELWLALATGRPGL